MAKPTSKLVNIQILRAVAALTVVLYHVGVEQTHICSDAGRGCSLDVWYGLDGVTLFFMISGFIMVVTSWNSFGKQGAAVDFMRRRIQRIVPLYWIVTTLAVIGISIAPSMLNVPVLDPIYIAASYLFYPVTRLNGLVRPIANLGWTLELEMMFYVIFTGALLFNRKLGMALALPAAALFLVGALGPQLNASNLLTRIGLLLGDASYSLYLIHPFILRPFAKIWAKLFVTHVPMWVFPCVAPIAAIASGLALYWLVERPLSNYFAKKQPLKLAPPLASSASALPQ